MSRIMLSELTGLSASTVSLLVGELIANGLVKETGTDENGSFGRKAILLELNENGGYFLVIEVLKTGIIFHLFDLLCQRVETLKCKVSDFENNKTIIDYANTLLKKNAIPEDLLFGINVIYPGIVDRVTHKLIYSVVVPEKSFFRDEDVTALKSEFPRAKFLLTKYSCAVAYAEYVFNQRPNMNKTILSVNIFEAVSAAAIIVNEKGERLYDFPIEFGHVIVDKEGPPCLCGNKGCLEAIVSSPKIFSDLVRDANLNLSYSNEFNDQTNVEAMLVVKSEMEKGNQAVIKKLDEIAEIIAFALINLTNTIDPSYVFINGLIILLGEPFISKIKEIYNTRNLKHLESPDVIYASTIDQDKRLMSSARMVMDEVFAFSYES